MSEPSLRSQNNLQFAHIAIGWPMSQEGADGVSACPPAASLGLTQGKLLLAKVIKGCPKTKFMVRGQLRCHWCFAEFAFTESSMWSLPMHNVRKRRSFIVKLKEKKGHICAALYKYHTMAEYFCINGRNYKQSFLWNYKKIPSKSIQHNIISSKRSRLKVKYDKWYAFYCHNRVITKCIIYFRKKRSFKKIHWKLNHL